MIVPSSLAFDNALIAPKFGEIAPDGCDGSECEIEVALLSHRLQFSAARRGADVAALALQPQRLRHGRVFHLAGHDVQALG